MNIDIDGLAEILRDAAKTEILPRFGRLDASAISEKSNALDIVTEADIAAEKFIQNAVSELMPEALFLGEELIAADPSLQDKLADAPLVVVVDPIDGTSNYAAGMPLFGVMASVIAHGETIGGIIYDPMLDEFMLAEKGAGAWRLRQDGERSKLTCASPVPLEQMVGTVSIRTLPDRGPVFANLIKVPLALGLRCSAHEYRNLISGQCHYLVHYMEIGALTSWDHAAGVLISTEAGAYVRRFDGSKYSPVHRDGGILGAPDQDSWQMLRSEVFTF